jgi:PAS domain-containing protein
LLIDITNKIKDEEELKYKTKFLETIYEEAFDGIMLFKPNSYEVINCNKRAFQIFETSDLDQLNEYLPNARKNKQTQKERDEMFKEISDGKIYDKEIEFITYKGNTVWLTMLVKLINLNNTELELVLVTDVSVLKKINSKLNLDKQKQILHVEQSPIGYIEWNTDFEVVEWNPSAEIIFGYTKEEALGRNAVFIIPDEVKPLIDEVWNSLKSKNGGFRSTNENITKSNEIVTLE